MTMRLSPLMWVERTLLVLAFVCGVWAFLAAAQNRFYASMPIPDPPLAVTQLPGEGTGAGDSTRAPAGPMPRGSWVARLDAASVGLSATVIEGSSDDLLARAAGHIEGTSLPGDSGNSGIAGHRDTTFRPVRMLRIGDAIRVTTTTHEAEYRITRTFVVDPDDVYVLEPTPQPTLTLVTCYPFTFVGHAPKRYIVQAELVGKRTREVKTDESKPKSEFLHF